METESRFVCEVCKTAIAAGERVMCDDGYERIMGEFVLGERDDLHEDNWPIAHADCAATEAGDRPRGELPRVRVVRGASKRPSE